MPDPNIIINQSGKIGFIISEFTNNVTGDFTLTLLLIFLILLIMAFVFRVPTDVSIIFLTPMLIIGMAWGGAFLTMGVILLIYLTFIIVRLFPFQ
jgi:hypothetical protein